jgi:hypothetical protein
MTHCALLKLPPPPCARILQEVCHMRRLPWLLALLLTMPSPAMAIQIHWNSGASDLVFSSATRCSLEVAADSGQVLPSGWHLVWAGTAPVSFVSVDSSSACGLSSAQAEHFDRPLTAVDSLTQLYHGYFCSNDLVHTSSAKVIMDLPDDSRGKFKVVYLNGSNVIVQSGLATYNGGLGSPFPPTLLLASSTHEGIQLTVDAIGINLGTVSATQVGAADNLWTIPLGITAKTDTTLTASADVPSLLPEAIFQATTPIGLAAEADLAAEMQTMATVTSSGTPDTIMYVDPNPKVYPKDFAFFYNSVPNPTETHRKGVFHLFYIRAIHGTEQDSIVAHAWCDTLGGAWTVDTLAFRPSGLTWDKTKVWAPSLLQVGGRTYMFYTGVDSLTNQSIGYAYTDSLFTTNIPWHRLKSPVYQAKNTGWADSVGHEVANRVEFRDPFLMQDPVNPGRYLLFNSGEDANHTTHYTIGVARNVAGTLGSWQDLGSYPATDFAHIPMITGAIESPLVVRDSLTGAWRMFIANANYDLAGHKSTYFLTQSAGDSVTYRPASAWPGLDSLYFYAGRDTSVIGWQACEHLEIGNVHFFAAYNGAGIGITRMHWDTTAHKFFFVHPTNASVGPGALSWPAVRFYLSALRPGAGVVLFTVDSPSSINPRVVVYDLAGRTVNEVASGQRMQGRRDFLWNCRDRAGQPVATGMYFARLTGVGAPQMVRVPIVK